MRRYPQTLVRLSVCLVAPAVLSACTHTASFLESHGPVAAEERDLFFAVIAWMAVVVVPVLVLVPVFAWRYRRSNSAAAYRANWKFYWPLEFFIWGVPVVVVAALSFLIVSKEIPLDPYAPLKSSEPPLEIEAVGLDWKWLFIYPKQGIATVNLFDLPSDRPVHIRLTSDTVMQSFFIPALGSQIYTMAGMVTQLNLKADHAGDRLLGLNTQFNGSGFSKQQFKVEVRSSQDFDRWIADIKTRGMRLDDRTYGVLSRRSTAAQARAQLDLPHPLSEIYFSAVDADLFAGIVGKYHGGTPMQPMAMSP